MGIRQRRLTSGCSRRASRAAFSGTWLLYCCPRFVAFRHDRARLNRKPLGLMKITLDHNCIIHLANQTDIGARIQEIVSRKENECFVVNIGASEMREKGVHPDHYEKFEELLDLARIADLPRLNPMAIWNVTFWDKHVWADDTMIKLAADIEQVLFGKAQKIDIAAEGLDSPAGRKWLNRLCDVHSMWCHIYSKNDVFLTTDGNFTKETKMPRLIVLGAGRICHPHAL